MIKKISLPLLLLASILVIYLCYIQAVPGYYYYDDVRPLSGLENVTDFRSAFSYIANEISGPLGRSVSMLSFLINIDDWPNAPEGFIRVNIAIHCINAILVFVFSAQIMKHFGIKSLIAPTLATLAWGLQPLIISTSLIIIQRMTGLSALFILISLNLYIFARLSSTLRDRIRFYLQFVAIFLFGLLAILSKETGALIPLYILIIDSTLLSKKLDTKNSYVKYFCILSFGLISLALLHFFYSNLFSNYTGRSFNSLERIFTQSVVLKDYILSAIFPSIMGFNPFHDDYKIYREFNANVALLTLLHVSLISFAIIKRKQNSLISFAILWFYGSHLIESTSIGLEMYFEHRNYIALLGICISLAIWICQLSNVRIKRIATIGISAYILVIAFFTYTIASVWSSPGFAAKNWHERQPSSPRAAENYALILLQQHSDREALEVLKKTIEACDTCIGTKMQAALVHCLSGDIPETIEYLTDASRIDPKQSWNIGNSHKMVTRLGEEIRNDSCAVDYSHVESAAQNLLRIPHIKNREELTIRFALVNQYLEEENFVKAIEQLEISWKLKPEPVIAEFLMNVYVRSGQPQQAIHFQKKVCSEELIQGNSDKLCKGDALDE